MSGSAETRSPASGPAVRARIRWSELAGRTVSDSAGHRIAGIEDAAVRFEDPGRPVLTALLLRRRRPPRHLRLTPESAGPLDAPRITAHGAPTDRPAPPGEVLLRADILSHRLVDLRLAQFARATDLQLAYDAGEWVVEGVELGRPGRRHHGTGRVVGWSACLPLLGHAPSREARRPFLRRCGLSPEQIADLVEQATDSEQVDLLDAAAAGSETESAVFGLLVPALAGRLLAARPDREIAAVLTPMPADTAADVVAGLPPERRGPVLRAFAAGPREAVSALLGSRPDSAVSVMRTDMLTAPATADARWARRHVTVSDGGTRPGQSAVYLVDERRRLTGVVGTAALAAAPPDAPLAGLAGLDPVAVLAGSGILDLAALMADRHLAAVPVVDDGGALLGLVTADEVIGVLMDDRRRRGERVLLP